MTENTASMQALDALNCPLTGVNLIEASAGTGKTWTIAALYTRLLLETRPDGSPPPALDRILVVTYTKAATAELRDRLRRRLVALSRVLDGEASDDSFLQALADRLAADNLALARERLRTAITGFDAAAIYTIHGFCQRMLTDAAFDSGQTFAAELVHDNAALLQQLTDDFWRRKIVAEPALAMLLAELGETPEQWLAEVRPHLAKPYLQLPQLAERNLLAVRQRLEEAWQALQAEPETLLTGGALLQTAKGLKQTSHKPEQCQRSLRLLALLCSSNALPVLAGAQVKELARLRQSVLDKAVKKGESAPVHRLFALVEDWLAAWDDYALVLRRQLSALKLQLIEWINEQSARQRRDTRQRGFDDLLTDLAAALADPVSGPPLAARLAASFDIALIDEFQDTDPLQYRIFRRSFVDEGRPVFMVGDPKQAIYSFRGADIFAYLGARDDAPPEKRYTLATNRRSQAPLVAAVNRLFARRQPFLLDGIDYHPVAAAPAGGTRLLLDDGDAAFNILQFPASDSDKAISKTEAGQGAAEACGHEIARLLTLAQQGAVQLEKNDEARALRGGDIAVLVATHRQGEMVREALAARGVTAVALSQQSVFASQEAAEMRLLLRAWVEPTAENRLKELCASELIGLDAAALLAQSEDEAQWEARLAANLADHQGWARQGFMPAWRAFMAREQLAQRVLPQAEGERRMTNLGHLAELLQQESQQLAGQAPLLAWFEAQLAAQTGGEEALLRLESDAELVKIVTIHTSKGLQYPLVFCPFLWDGALERRDTAFWRLRADGAAQLLPDALLGDAERELARGEMLAEKLRLLYVALTRAEHRQYVVWGHVKDMQTAALSWLWHGESAANLGELAELKLDDATIRQQLASFARDLPAAVVCREVELARNSVPQAAQAQFVPQLAMISRPLYTPWRMASFTSLTRDLHGHAPALAERPDHDSGSLLLASDILLDERFAFPRGARAGTCLHEMFENIDFSQPEAWPQAVAASLHRHGFAEDWQPAALSMLQAAIRHELAPGVRLAEVRPAERLVEMEFTLPADGLDVARLRRILCEPAMGLAAPLRAAAATLDFERVRGFLKGFIDLVFRRGEEVWLVDYKSNHLGDDFAAYDKEALAASIAREHYYLQYLIYAVAVRRYLAQRGGSLRLAGVAYLYLRGIDGAGHGIWHDQPSAALLDALDELFAVHGKNTA